MKTFKEFVQEKVNEAAQASAQLNTQQLGQLSGLIIKFLRSKYPGLDNDNLYSAAMNMGPKVIFQSIVKMNPAPDNLDPFVAMNNEPLFSGKKIIGLPNRQSLKISVNDVILAINGLQTGGQQMALPQGYGASFQPGSSQATQSPQAIRQ